MPLSQHDIDTLRDIYERDTGIRLTNDEAWDFGHRLLRLYAVVLRRPLPDADEGSSRVSFDDWPTSR